MCALQKDIQLRLLWVVYPNLNLNASVSTHWDRLGLLSAAVQCRPYLFENGVEAGAAAPNPKCKNSVALNAGETCSIQCGAGFAAFASTVSCPLNAVSGQTAAGNLACKANRCAPFAFGDGVIAGEGEAGCSGYMHGELEAGSSCAVRCNPAGFQTQTGTVTCALTAAEGFPGTSPAISTLTECSREGPCTHTRFFYVRTMFARSCEPFIFTIQNAGSNPFLCCWE